MYHHKEAEEIEDVLPILTGETIFYSTSRGLAGSDLFPMFTQSINFYTFYCCILKSTDVIHQIDRNEWLLLSAFQEGLRQILGWFLS